ncbi:PIG-L deacetylase family protein [Bacillus marinisedimentorum]|uniref:PIG-L deacetylase family protein n=1 Tax=Bacillus marinisedimentorum TaxID=1821260 RepID=UPI0007E0C613|nr:PIG-L family deacetylase [Bacillus marinisedimentorum]
MHLFKKVTLAVIFVFSLYLIIEEDLHAVSSSNNIAFFYVSHQDDELLTMGNAIVDHLHNGFDVHVVLLTDGAASTSIKTVNDKLNEESYNSITVEQFSKARNREFLRSASALGVKRKNIHFENLRDGKTTTDQINKIMRRYSALYPNARHNSFSYHDDHRDHQNSGLSLLNLYNHGFINNVLFYIQNREMSQIDGQYDYYGHEYDPFIQQAIHAYSEWNPARYKYAIGRTSVSYDFELLLNDPRSKYHLPNQ